MKNRNPFKVLRAVDASVLGATTKPLEVSSGAKRDFQPNAKGGLRLVNSDDIRMLARNSAQAVLKALENGNVRSNAEV